MPYHGYKTTWLIVPSLSKLGSRVPLTIHSRQVFPKDLTLDRFCSWHTSTICRRSWHHQQISTPTTHYVLHDTVEQASALQRNINAAVTWATTWRGGFSAAKTVLLHIGNRNRFGDHTLNISGQPLQADTHHKHLGLIFSDSLSWSYHLDKLIISSRRKAGLLRYMIPNMSASVSSKLYLTWVRPTMEYACPVWHASISKEDSLTLERIQASVARRILQADWSTPKELLFQSLDWPALWWRRSVLSVCLLFDLMTNAT